MKTVLKIFTDGGARGNPGPGAAAFIAIKDGRIINKDSKYLGFTTNNEAEYHGVILALKWLLRSSLAASFTKISFFLDSELVTQQLEGNYKVKSENLKKLNLEVRVLVEKLETKDINFLSVAREKNKIADRLVNERLDENKD
ncbi:MAG: Ribonuclease H [Candidatus Woesebacteria bacterium GW2011_GWB1_39_10b]|uniref:Ribonuclease H n=3 Tax=Candidatus Woeseibacteriota TaxID=1752722 RepID=A0A0G0NKR7_9BACT|nr:MAG: ribonuclease HI, ribonuclease HI [Microgenomates group bacterium GW2011_GWC1_38_12]KKQ93677.1 MAG: Ribonuclease H [Candidatus Woesebacteria bacterium GW2011_GWB1_39_10b]KKR13421.1 MAG: Ribonuclease H [Candidatus Woesebacteria bacterium GW2011_GWA1_39_21b]OGM63292.1 MAG: hypothetical protein A3A52_03755 [Candidatus Woesebacteria bacterium RIFCSPLOWO2_01_FULL_39_14]